MEFLQADNVIANNVITVIQNFIAARVCGMFCMGVDVELGKQEVIKKILSTAWIPLLVEWRFFLHRICAGWSLLWP